MTALSQFAYAQSRLQSRYGQRADETVWLRLHTVRDLASYLQLSQQGSLRPWVLGISAMHSSHEIELAIRQQYRRHVDEVASWMPAEWRVVFPWLKRLGDLPVLQYLLAGGVVMEWMRADPDLNAYTGDDTVLRMQALHEAGCGSLVHAWQQGDSLFTGWLSGWRQSQPHTPAFVEGLHSIDKYLQKQQLLQTEMLTVMDYAVMTDGLRLIFRRYAFQPAAVFAYLAIIALDLHHLRSDLLSRLLFKDNDELNTDLAA